MNMLMRLHVNGRIHELYLPVQITLLEVLRERLGLVGTKHGCELGECGACTVLVDGQPRLSCLTLAADLQQRAITTVEGLGSVTQPHPLQAAFAAAGAVQCGYCTPGMLISASALLERNPSPTRTQIKEALSGNLCRCTGYLQIVEAVAEAASQLDPTAGRQGGAEAREGEQDV